MIDEFDLGESVIKVPNFTKMFNAWKGKNLKIVQSINGTIQDEYLLNNNWTWNFSDQYVLTFKDAHKTIILEDDNCIDMSTWYQNTQQLKFFNSKIDTMVEPI